MLRPLLYRVGVIVIGMALHCAACAAAEKPPGKSASAEPSPQAVKPAPKEAELEAAFSKMLSGATLEGSYTNTGKGSDPAKLSGEKYTLGEVKKLQGDYWLIPARIQYGDKDVTIPLTLPVRWAGDTPMIVVDELGLPGFGTVSARVMFFADHYAGYWKHGKSGGHLFGTVSHAAKETSGSTNAASAPSGNPADGE
jgi:hypothetical protein